MSSQPTLGQVITPPDIAQLLEIIAGVVGHPALTYQVLPATQALLKNFLSIRGPLTDPTILSPLDRILKYGVAAQIPASAISGLQPFNLSDYITPVLLEQPATESTDGSVPESTTV